MYSAWVCSTQIRAAHLAATPFAPGVLLAQGRVAIQFLRRGADLGGELVGQTPIALVNLGFHRRVLAELLGDALGAHGGLAVHPAGPDHAAEQGAALVVAAGGGLDGVLLLLAGDERLTSGASRARAADLYLGAIDPQADAFCVGVGEHVLQCAQPQPGPVGHREAPGCQQRADLADRVGDGGAVHPIQLGQCRMWQPQPQMDKGGQQPIDEDQLLFASGTRCPPAFPAAPLAQRGLPGRSPPRRELFEQLAEVCARDPGQGRMGTGRTGPGHLHNSPNLCGLTPSRVGRPPRLGRVSCTTTW